MMYIGAACLLFGCVMVSRAYRKHLEWQLLLLSGFIEFLRKMNTHTSSYLEPIKKWIGDFECPVLREVGFLDALKEGKLPKEAYRGLKIRPASKEADRALSDFFARTGVGYLNEEVAAQNRCLGELTRVLDAEGGELVRKTKVFSAALFAIVGGVLLLLL